ncbi:MAG: signal peptidase I [Armatimonadetes bacterium]|nr:signal peptidase I [Armatimonadota bacterium]
MTQSPDDLREPDAAEAAVGDPAREQEGLPCLEHEQATASPDEAPGAPVTAPDPEVQWSAARRAADSRRMRRMRIIAPIMVLLAFLCWVYTTHYIPSPSMTPTLMPGDHILAMRSWIAYPNGAIPKRGDIVVFLPPEQPGTPEGYYSTVPEEPVSTNAVDRLKEIVARRRNVEVWIKRVVGLPGEVVQIAQGSVFINGRELDRRYYNRQPDAGPDYPYMFGFLPVQLGADEVFVLGDNPLDSDDSRFWGALKVGSITSKFVRVIFREGSNGPNARKARSEQGQGG